MLLTLDTAEAHLCVLHVTVQFLKSLNDCTNIIHRVKCTPGGILPYRWQWFARRRTDSSIVYSMKLLYLEKLALFARHSSRLDEVESLHWFLTKCGLNSLAILINYHMGKVN